MNCLLEIHIINNSVDIVAMRNSAVAAAYQPPTKFSDDGDYDTGGFLTMMLGGPVRTPGGFFAGPPTGGQSSATMAPSMPAAADFDGGFLAGGLDGSLYAPSAVPRHSPLAELAPAALGTTATTSWPWALCAAAAAGCDGGSPRVPSAGCRSFPKLGGAPAALGTAATTTSEPWALSAAAATSYGDGSPCAGARRATVCA